jgi:hypothetical protein
MKELLQTQNHTDYSTHTAEFRNEQEVLRSSYYHLAYVVHFGFGGLGVVCWLLVPKFAGSNPAEAIGFLRAKKSSARLPSEGK